MNFLIFLVSVIFSLVFYFFYLVSNNKNIFWFDFSSPTYFFPLSWSLIYESILFVVLWVFFYLFFSDFSFKKKENKDFLEQDLDFEDLTKNNFFEKYIDKKKLYKNTWLFFKNYLYYIGFIFIYLSIYFIYKSYTLDTFSYVILFLNIFVLLAFFISNKFAFLNWRIYFFIPR